VVFASFRAFATLLIFAVESKSCSGIAFPIQRPSHTQNTG
jgi:hypothetical protein